MGEEGTDKSPKGPTLTQSSPAEGADRSPKGSAHTHLHSRPEEKRREKAAKELSAARGKLCLSVFPPP